MSFVILVKFYKSQELLQFQTLFYLLGVVLTLLLQLTEIQLNFYLNLGQQPVLLINLKIAEFAKKNKLTKELEKYNEDVAKYNKISSFIKDDFESKKEEFNKFFSCIDGSPNFKNRDTYAFIDKFNASDGNKKILETDIFKRFKAKL